MSNSTIQPTDIMDSKEVAEALGLSVSAINVALSTPDLYPGLARRLPPPLRKVGQRVRIWRRADIEAMLEADRTEEPWDA